MTAWEFMDRNGFGLFVLVCVVLWSLPSIIRAVRGTPEPKDDDDD